MKILIATDKFKGSLTAEEVAEAIEKGFHRVSPEIEMVSCPMADGGEGTVRVVVRSTGGELRELEVTGPLPDMKIMARWCFLPGAGSGESTRSTEGLLGSTGGAVGVVEMAQASGLYRVPAGKENPFLTTTRGTGELIKASLDSGCERIIVGMGGSATVGVGTGMARALGYRFLDGSGAEVDEGGAGLIEIDRVDCTGADPRLEEVEFVAASDVDNTLCGPKGAAYTYGPQKGADEGQVKVLEEGMRNLARVIERDLGLRVMEIQGSGAAGGLGAGLVAFCGAEIRPGVEVVAEVVGLREKLEEVNLVVTGEGKVDSQTARGKTPMGVAWMAKELSIPVVIIGGWVIPGTDRELAEHVDIIFSVSPAPRDLETAMRHAARDVEEGAARLLRILLLGRGMG